MYKDVIFGSHFPCSAQQILLAFFNAPSSEELCIGFETLVIRTLGNGVILVVVFIFLEVVVCHDFK